MRVAVSYEDGNVFSPFSGTKSLKLYELEGSSILRETIVPTWGEGSEAQMECLKQYAANVLICGAVEGAVRAKLLDDGILTYAGVIGKADTAVQAFLNGTLQATPDGSKCDGHSCGGSCEGCGGSCPGASGCKSDL